MKKKAKVVMIAICSVMLVLILIINFAVSVFFRYYSIISVSEEDYSDVLVSFSDEEITDVSDVEIELPEESIFSSKDVINILLIGTDEHTEEFKRGSRSDSMMPISLNKKTKDVKLVSFERDTFVTIPRTFVRNPDKLCHAFAFGGAPLLLETIQNHFRLDVEKYVRVNFFVFEKLVDVIGGVDIELTSVEASIISSQTGSMVKEGKNHLNGAAALCYSRIRKIDDDFGRINRQQNVIVAIKKSFNAKSAGELKDILDACLPYVQTNLSAYECASLLLNIKDYSKGHVSRLTIPDRSTYYSSKKIDFKSNAKILRDFLYQN